MENSWNHWKNLGHIQEKQRKNYRKQLLDDTPMGGSPRPMEPMGPHRPRALKYTPMGPHRPRALKYTPTGGPRGPSALAHRPWPIGPGPWSPWGPIWACIFGFCIFGAKSTLLGSQSVDSLAPWGVQTEPLFNKDCLQSFPGPLGPPSTRLYQFTDSKIFKFFNFFFDFFWPGIHPGPFLYMFSIKKS